MRKNVQNLLTVVVFATAALLASLPGSVLAKTVAEQVPSPSSDDVVYATAHGKRYHRKDCRYAKDASPMSRKDAEAKGLTPCKVCKP
jgi:hypothetical protein